MRDIVHSCGKEDVSEMMPSLCYYYRESLYCQSFQVRSEVNKGRSAAKSRL